MKNPNTYRARFAGLRIHAFGKEQILAGELDVVIYQARVSPELWLSRLKCRQVGLESEWRASSAELLMEHIATYFEQCITPWERVPRLPAPVCFHCGKTVTDPTNHISGPGGCWTGPEAA
jgi:hypothetical protein